MIYIEEALKKFLTLPLEVILEFNHPKVTKRLKAIEDKYQIELSSLLIYVAIDEITFEDIPEYLTDQFNIASEQSMIIKEELIDSVLDPLFERLKFLMPENNKSDFTIESEKRYILELFQNGLLSELNNFSITLKAVNQRIFFVLCQDQAFKEEMLKALFLNNEVLSRSSFLMNGEMANPTVSNWLKDFLHTIGSKMFDMLELSQYSTMSENGKKLNEQERKLLIKLLRTYYNIKFFPDSMPDDEGERWEILHIEDEESAQPETLKKDDLVINLKPGGINTEIATPRTESIDIPDKPAPVEQPSPQAPRNTRVDELKDMAARYPEGSLERRMIEQEIKKLNNES